MFNNLFRAERNVYVNWSQLNLATMIFEMLGIDYKLSRVNIRGLGESCRLTFKTTNKQAQDLYVKLRKYGVQNG